MLILPDDFYQKKKQTPSPPLPPKQNNKNQAGSVQAAWQTLMILSSVLVSSAFS